MIINWVSLPDMLVSNEGHFLSSQGWWAHSQLCKLDWKKLKFDQFSMIHEYLIDVVYN